MASIRNREECPLYEGLEIEPQIGLVPLGRDPDSGLWEFAHVESGEIPERSSDGKLILREESALVLVLIPGGSFWMGAARPLRLRFPEDGNDLRIVEVLTGSGAEKAGIEVGDVVLSVHDEEVKTRADFQRVTAPFRSGQRVNVEVLRDEGRKTFIVELGANVDPQAVDNEIPVHEVPLTAFFLAKYEMTQGQWLRLTGENPSTFGPEETHGGKKHSLLHPVEEVSWEMCDAVLSRFGLTLPTEAQWEYGARAGAKTATPWWTGKERESLLGKVNLADQAAWRAGHRWSRIREWRELDDGYVFHAPVGTFAANKFGLHEVHGNVWEWCRDGFGDYGLPVKAGDGERQVSAGARFRVRRGAGYRWSAVFARSTARYMYNYGVGGRESGVRPARGVEP